MRIVTSVIVSARRGITLDKLMTESQLSRLIRLATGDSNAAWPSHEISCLLQDLLEGGIFSTKSSIILSGRFVDHFSV